MGYGEQVEKWMRNICPWVLLLWRINSAVLSVRHFFVIVWSQVRIKVSFDDVDCWGFVLSKIWNYQVQEVNEDWQVKETHTTEGFPKIRGGFVNESCW